MPYDTKRYQFEVPIEGARSIDQMKDMIRAKSNADLFENALTLFHWALTNAQQGRMIASMDKNEENYRVLTMPVLERVRSGAVGSGSTSMSGSISAAAING